MTLITTNVMNDFSEVISYGNPHIPIYARRSLLSEYTDRKAICHWHDDVEYIAVLKGSMRYYINGKVLTLKENDILIVSPRQLHYGYANGNENCDFICTLINPAVFKGNTAVYTSFVEPVINNISQEKILLSDNDAQKDILHYLQKLIELTAQTHTDNTLKYFGFAYFLWQEYFNLLKNNLNTAKTDLNTEINIAKNMVSFIYQNYQDNLSLMQIAASANVCRNKCCQLFRQYLKQTPIDFLNSYRLEKSKNYLQNSSLSITQIAFNCGFNSVSYYIELFHRKNKCTPRQFRNRYREK